MDAVDLHVVQFPVMEQVVERRAHSAAIVIGALIILDDGSECVVAGYAQTGNILRVPPSE